MTPFFTWFENRAGILSPVPSWTRRRPPKTSGLFWKNLATKNKIWNTLTCVSPIRFFTALENPVDKDGPSRSFYRFQAFKPGIRVSRFDFKAIDRPPRGALEQSRGKGKIGAGWGNPLGG